jgi:Fe-S cluster assembly ATP-binding protein
MEKSLIIRDLHVRVAGAEEEILKGLSLELEKGRIHAIMGPNGSGKSTLSYALAGHPGYEVTGGEVLFNGQDVLEMGPDERAQAGIFLAFQYPMSIPGVSMANFLRTAVNSVRRARGEGEMRVPEFRRMLQEKMAMLRMDRSFMSRYLNEGFSGGEKKRAEILQMAMLRPTVAIMDETDSGLDIDALRIVSDGVNALRNPEMSVLIITHYQRMLNYIAPDYVHVLMDGRIVTSGGPELALELESKGYDGVRQEFAVPA